MSHRSEDNFARQMVEPQDVTLADGDQLIDTLQRTPEEQSAHIQHVETEAEQSKAEASRLQAELHRVNEETFTEPSKTKAAPCTRGTEPSCNADATRLNTDAEPLKAKRARFQTAEGAPSTTGGRQTSEALRVTHADPTEDHTPRQGDEPNTPFDGEPTPRHTKVTSPAPDGPPLVTAAEAVALRSVDAHVESPRPKDDDPLKDENRALRQENERLRGLIQEYGPPFDEEWTHVNVDAMSRPQRPSEEPTTATSGTVVWEHRLRVAEAVAVPEALPVCVAEGQLEGQQRHIDRPSHAPHNNTPFMTAEDDGEITPHRQRAKTDVAPSHPVSPCVVTRVRPLEAQTERRRTEIEAYRAALHYHSLNELR